MNIKLLIEGGDMKPGPAIAQQIGPLGINMGKVISEINIVTKEFKGMKVPVELIVNEKTKSFVVKTSSPPTSELLRKELGLEKGSSNQKVFIANASIEDIIKVAKIKFPNMLQREFKSAVKSVLGTCASIGILVENKNANELIPEINTFEKEIKSQKTETDNEKRKLLAQFFSEVKNVQDIKLKQEQEAQAAKEAEKAAAAGTPATEVKSEAKVAEKKTEETKKK